MPTPTRVLVVDADGARASALVELLAPAGFAAWHSRSASSAEPSADVVLLSADAVDCAAVTGLAASVPDADVVVVATDHTPVLARDALRLGACEVLPRAAGADALLAALERAAREGRNRRELAMLRARVGDDARHALAGTSAPTTLVRELIGRAAASRRTVLVTGEAGAGKSTAARLVHDLSTRAGRPFAVVRCDGADPDVLEAELFGSGREGLLETVRGGTLVLEEVRALPRALYARLAALVAERVIRRGGSRDPHAVDVRLVLTARTTEHEPALDADALLGDHNVLPIALPPLRERRRDIPLLVQHFRERLVATRGPLRPLGTETTTPLLAHHWPGNVRELEHWVTRVALAAASEGENVVARPVSVPGAEFALLDAAHLTLGALERRYILHVLAREGGHQSRAADRLGIDRRTLYRKLKEYRDEGITVRIAG